MAAALSLRSKLVLLMLIVQVSMLLLLVGNSVLQMQASLREQAELRMQQLAASLHPALVSALAQDHYTALLQELVHESRLAGDLARVAVFSETGELLAVSERAESDFEQEADLLSSYVPLRLAGLHYGHLEISMPDHFLREAQASLLARSLVIASVAIVFSTLLVNFAARWLMRHLDALRATSAAWARGEFWKKAPVKSRDEIGRLAEEFNRMAVTLQERESALRQAQEEFRAIADYTYSWESWIDPDGRPLWMNPSIERISGYSVAEGLALDDYPCKLLYPGDAQQVEQIRERMRSGEAGEGEELRLMTKQGDIRWVHLNWQSIQDKAGNSLGVRTSILDITPRIQLEQALRQSEARFAAAARVAKLGHWEWSLAEGGLHWSEEIYRIVGLPQETRMSYERFLGLVVPAEREQVDQAIQHALKHEQSYSKECQLRRSDGATRYVQTQAQIERDRNGTPVRMFGTTQDITEHKEAQLALARINRTHAVLSETNKTVVRERDQAALFRRVCQIIVEVGGLQLAWVGAVDAETNNVLPIAFDGPASAYVYGLRIRMNDPQQAQGPITRAVRSGRLQTHQDISSAVEMEAWRERAASFSLRSITVAPLRQHGEVVAVLAVYSDEVNYFSSDIAALLEAQAADLSFALHTFAEESRRRRAEAKLVRLNAELEARVIERTQALKAANEELEAFSYSVSHDLRAPLRSIEGFSRQLLDQHATQLDETGLDYLGRIVRASSRMEQLIADLLRLSQIGRQALRPRQLDLSALAQLVIDELKQAEPERQIYVEIEPELSVRADPQLLRIVLENLLGNAWKFTADKDIGQIELGSIQNKEQQILFIRDNGAGFDDRFVHRLFAPFQRLHSDREFQGTGIGLATVQRIINKHGGRIWAEGEVGAGATFFFTFSKQLNQENRYAEGIA